MLYSILIYLEKYGILVVERNRKKEKEEEKKMCACTFPYYPVYFDVCVY